MKKSLILSITALLAGFIPALPVSAEVMIAPTRVVLEEDARSAELVLVNKGDEEAAFRVSIENRRMNIDGSLETAEAAKDGELFASDFIRFTPRRVVLEPGARQTIRVSAQTAGLAPGEYRSHLRIMSAPMSAGRTLESAAGSSDDGISIQLVAVRSLTIPVIVRVGALEASVEIQEMELNPSENADETFFVARLTREGSKSVYGDVHLYVEGQSEPVYMARGVAIYTPNTHRDITLALPDAVTQQIAGRKVRIAYISSDPQSPEVMAEHKAVLN